VAEGVRPGVAEGVRVQVRDAGVGAAALEHRLDPIAIKGRAASAAQPEPRRLRIPRSRCPDAGRGVLVSLALALQSTAEVPDPGEPASGGVAGVALADLDQPPRMCWRSSCFGRLSTFTKLRLTTRDVILAPSDLDSRFGPAQTFRMADAGDANSPASAGLVAAGTSEPARPFVGRLRELGELSAVVAESAAGRGGLFMVTGEPGIGKSRLMEEVRRTAR
jgi:hypothetical protein